MPRIIIEARSVASTPFDHMYLVYDMDDINNNLGTEFVLRGGTANPFSITTPFTDADNLEINHVKDKSKSGIIPLLLEDSQDARDLYDEDQIEGQRNIIMLESISVEAAWAVMESYALSIQAAQLDYELPLEGGELINNSNATIASLLYTIGIDIRNFSPTNTSIGFYTPGSSTILDIESKIQGSNEKDIIVGAGKNDTIYGNGGDDTIYGDSNPNIDLAEYDDEEELIGNDFLHGGSGNNSIYGGKGSDIIIGAGNRDTLEGGEDTDAIGSFSPKDSYENLTVLYGNSAEDTLGDNTTDHFGVFGWGVVKDIEREDRVYVNNLEVRGGVKQAVWDEQVAWNPFSGHGFQLYNGSSEQENGATLAVKWLWDTDAIAFVENYNHRYLEQCDGNIEVYEEELVDQWEALNNLWKTIQAIGFYRSNPDGVILAAQSANDNQHIHTELALIKVA